MSENFSEFLIKKKGFNVDDIYYHGTKFQFDEFKIGLKTKNVALFGIEVETERHAVFVSKDKELCSQFGEVKEVFLNIKNTLDLDSKEGYVIEKELINEIKNSGREDFIREIRDSSFQAWGYFDDDLGKFSNIFFRNKGYDSVSFDEEVNGIESKTIAILDPKNVIFKNIELNNDKKIKNKIKP